MFRKHHDCCGGHGGCCGGHHHEPSHEHHGCGCNGHHDDFHAPQGFTVQFSGVFEENIDRVWEVLTDNEWLQKWFPELEFEAVQTGSKLYFNYVDGGREEMMVLDVEVPHLLSFMWDIHIVSFELNQIDEQHTELVFTEWLSEMNDHAPKDVTGWMVNLQAMASIIEGEEFGNREEKFHEYYPRVKEMLEQQMEMEFED